MMSCKELSLLVSKGELAAAPLARRSAAWLHLAMCRHCRAFRRQLEAVARVAHLAAAADEAEPAASFESRIVDRLRE